MPRRTDPWNADLRPEDMRLDLEFLSRKPSRRRQSRISVRFSWTRLDPNDKQQLMQRWYPFLRKKKKKDKDTG